MRLGGVGIHAAGAVYQSEFVGVDVQFGKRPVGVGAGRGGFKKFPLGAHRHVFARTHGQRPGEQPGNAGEQHIAGVYTRSDHAEHQSQVGYQAVVGAEHGGAEIAGHFFPAFRSESAHHFGVDALVGGHLVGGVVVFFVGGARLGGLHQRQGEHGAESFGQKPHEQGGVVGPARHAHVVAKEGSPMFFVACLGLGDAQQNFAFLTLLFQGEFPVNGSFGAFVGQVALPAFDLLAGWRGRRCCGGSCHLFHPTESAVAPRVFQHCGVEVVGGEVGEEFVLVHHFGVGRLPEQEVGGAFLTGGA